MSESKTPETDSHELPCGWDTTWPVVKSDFARKLEQERDEARKERGDAVTQRNEANGYLCGCSKHGMWHGMDCVGCMESERDALRAELAKCREALDRVASLYENPEPPSFHEQNMRAYDMRCIARETLKQTK